MSETDREQLVAALREALEPLPQVVAGFLFGSRATGRAHDESDIDVALLLEPSVANADARLTLQRLIIALGTRVAADRLHLVVLNHAPPALAFQVLKHGVLLFDRAPDVLLEYRVRVYSAHADFEPTERFFREVTRQRALKGRAHGSRGNPASTRRGHARVPARARRGRGTESLSPHVGRP